MQHQRGVRLTRCGALRSLPASEQLRFARTAALVGQLQAAGGLRLVVGVVEGVAIANGQIVGAGGIAQEHDYAERFADLNGLDERLDGGESAALDVQPAVDAAAGRRNVDHFQLIDDERLEDDGALVDDGGVRVGRVVLVNSCALAEVARHQWTIAGDASSRVPDLLHVFVRLDDQNVGDGVAQLAAAFAAASLDRHAERVHRIRSTRRDVSAKRRKEIYIRKSSITPYRETTHRHFS